MNDEFYCPRCKYFYKKSDEAPETLEELTQEICIQKEEMNRLGATNKQYVEKLKNIMNEQEVEKIEEVKATNETFNVVQDRKWRQAPLNKKFIYETLCDYVTSYGNVVDPDKIVDFIWEERKNKGMEKDVFSVRAKKQSKKKPKSDSLRERRVIDMSNTPAPNQTQYKQTSNKLNDLL